VLVVWSRGSVCGLWFTDVGCETVKRYADANAGVQKSKMRWLSAVSWSVDELLEKDSGSRVDIESRAWHHVLQRPSF
jgi:hypothetical protein